MSAKPVYQTLLHIAAYYAVWFACMVGAAHSLSWLAVAVGLVVFCFQLLWQYRSVTDRQSLIRLIVMITLSGLLIDSSMVWFDLIRYQDNAFLPYLCPPWIIVLWLIFSIVLFAECRWLWAKPLFTAVCAFFGFALAYKGGAVMGAAILTHGWISAVIVGGLWMFLLPLILLFEHKKGVSA